MKKFVSLILVALMLAAVPLQSFAATQSPPEGLEAKVAAWKNANSDAIGWLSVPDTKINNIVMWYPDDRNSYYLRRNPNKEHSFDGSYFADYRCDYKDGNLANNTVIYGHSFDDDPNSRRFGQLKKYFDADFAKQHPYIYFSDGNETYTFKIFSVFTININEDSVPYNVPNLDTDALQEVLDYAKKNSIHKYDYTPTTNSKLLTLSTVYYNGEGEGYPTYERFVIMARAVKSAAKWSSLREF